MLTHCRYRRATLAGLLLSVGSASAEPACAGFEVDGPVAERVRSLEVGGAAGNVTGQTLQDTEQMLSPEYFAIGPDGSVTDRADILKTYGNGKRPGWAVSFEIKSLGIRVYCDTAVVTGLAEATGKDANGTLRQAQFRWLNVWYQADGDWRLVASQFARK